MRQVFIPDTDAETIEQAREVAPWAAEIIECDGGWQAFESPDDAETWQAQS
jgi:hypothetical protein